MRPSCPPRPPLRLDAALAKAENRVALVVGNSGYTAAPALTIPKRDAARVADALRGAGLRTVTVVPDAGRAEMIAALNAFTEEAERADWALVYFAGHGIKVGGVDDLVPIDAELKSDRDVGDEAVPLERVLQAIEPARKLRLVILDACRDNPFTDKTRRTTATRSVGRGLAKIEPEGGTLVAYAAEKRSTATATTAPSSSLSAAASPLLGSTSTSCSASRATTCSPPRASARSPSSTAPCRATIFLFIQARVGAALAPGHAPACRRPLSPDERSLEHFRVRWSRLT